MTYTKPDERTVAEGKPGPAAPQALRPGIHTTAGAQKLMALNSTLRNIGTQQGSSQVPCVYVIGDQSSGKSSLVEGLTGLTLPKNSGTCTRCPTEIRMSSGASQDGSGWATVSLHKTKDATGAALTSPQLLPFASLDDPSQGMQLQHYIRAGQKALLNPEQPVDKYAKAAAAAASAADADKSSSDSEEEPDELQFTANSVVVSITNAGLDFNLIDLPGIIHYVHGDMMYVDLVKTMVKDLVKEEAAIMAVVLPCTTDIETQAVMEIARAADPEGVRSIGVLTKPDIMANPKAWEGIIGGTKHGLELGYFAVRSRTQDQLDAGVTLEEAANQEADFFRASPYFRPMEGRLGTGRLRVALMDLLVERMRDNLPAIKQDINTKLAEVMAALRALPPPPSSNPSADLVALLRRLEDELASAIKGTSGSKQLRQAIDRLYKQLQDDAMAQAPLFCPPIQPRRALTPEQCTAAAAAAASAHGWSSTAFWVASRDLSREANASATTRQVLTLDSARGLVQRSQVLSLPGMLPDVTLELIQLCRGPYNVLADSCMRGVADLVADAVVARTAEVFASYPNATPYMQELLQDVLQGVQGDTDTSLDTLAATEQHNAFTLNSEAFLDAQRSMAEAMACAYAEHKLGDIKYKEEVDGPGVMSALRDAGLVGITWAGLVALSLRSSNGSEDYSLMEMTARALAYCKVSLARFIDQVPLHIEQHLLGAFIEGARKRLQGLPGELLRQGQAPLDGSSPAAAAPAPSVQELMEEDLRVAERRRHLKEVEEKLRGAARLLHTF